MNKHSIIACICNDTVYISFCKDTGRECGINLSEFHPTIVFVKSKCTSINIEIDYSTCIIVRKPE